MRTPVLLAAALLAAGLAACGESPQTPFTSPHPPVAAELLPDDAPAPGSLVPVTVGAVHREIWPFLSATLESPDDPVNLIFAGKADPRAIRSALLGLDGNRAGFGFPPGAPFDCAWTDAIGSLQGAFVQAGGWRGSAIQLQCGGFGPVRFHLRLFAAGDLTLGGAHFEVLIPGTTDHQVLSWELAEQLVTADLVRSGLLGAAPGSTGPISPVPYRDIPPIIYNGLPAGLQQLAGGPTGPVSTPVPILTDGSATILTLAGEAEPAPGSAQHFVIQFDQVIPRPFCAQSPAEYLSVQGPVTFDKTVRVLENGALETRYHASGMLSVAPIDPSSGEATGDPYRAEVDDQQLTSELGLNGWIVGELHQAELPQADGHGRMAETIRVGQGRTGYTKTIRCTPTE